MAAGIIGKNTTGILSLYTDETHGYVAFCEPGIPPTKVSCTWTAEYRQAVGFVPLLQELSQKASISTESIWQRTRTIIIPKGPTSFTTLRITLSVAQAIAFSLPEAQVFAPSHFHVFALKAEKQAPETHEVVLLLNAFKPGFYGAVLSVGHPFRPYFSEPPAYYPPEAGSIFLAKYAHLPVFSNFSKNIDAGVPVVAVLDSSPAETQIALFQRTMSPHDMFDYTSLLPYYVDLPPYKKNES